MRLKCLAIGGLLGKRTPLLRPRWGRPGVGRGSPGLPRPTRCSGAKGRRDCSRQRPGDWPLLLTGCGPPKGRTLGVPRHPSAAPPRRGRLQRRQSPAPSTSCPGGPAEQGGSAEKSGLWACTARWSPSISTVRGRLPPARPWALGPASSGGPRWEWAGEAGGGGDPAVPWAEWSRHPLNEEVCATRSVSTCVEGAWLCISGCVLHGWPR